MRFGSTKHGSLALVAALALFGCSGAESPSVAEAPAATKTEETVPVTVAPVIFRPTAQVLKFVGTLFGNEEVTLSSEVDGQIETLHADLGDPVQREEVLLEIEDDNLRARLREIEATLAKARTDEKRGRELAAAKVISPQEYEAMQTALAVGEAQRDTLNVLLRDTSVRSPLSGYVARRHVSVGEYVRAGTPLFDLVADQPLKLRGDVPERFAGDLAVEQKVQIRVDAYPDAVFRGTLARISPTANRENRSITVEALIENADRKLKPGFFANAGIVTRSDSEAMVVPETAVLNFAGVTKLFVIRDGMAYERKVRTGTRDAQGLVEILEGVNPAEEVATSGLAKLANGTPVVVNRPES
jgi:membrane fusion protein (multidrug efflux system)